MEPTAAVRATPSARIRAWLRRWGLGVGIAFVMLYAFPYYPKIKSANELPRIYLTQAMVDRGTFAIDHGVDVTEKTADVSEWNGHAYSNKAPGSSMLAIPGYLVVKAVNGGGEPSVAAMMWMSRFTTGILPTLAFLVLVWGFLARFAPDANVRRAVVVAYALGSMALVYSVLFISHQLSAICIASAWILAYQVTAGERAHPARWMAVAGFLAGCAPLCDYQAAFAGVPVAIALVWRLWRRPDRWKLLAITAGAAAVPIAVLLAYHQACFDSPLRTGYDASQTWASYHQKGFLGITALRAEAFYGSMFAPDNGLVTLAPWLLLAIPGTWLLWRRGGRDRELGVVGAAVAVIYILFITSINFWRGGWQVGPRYITVMLPFVLPAVAAVLSEVDARAVLRGLALGLVVVGVIVYTVAVATYPHWPDRYQHGNPLYEVSFRLLREGHAPYSLGWAAGLRGVASLVPYFAVVAVLLGWALAPARRYVRSAAIAGVVGVAIVAAYAAFPRGGKKHEAAYREYVAGAMPR
jgi:hypothetical protein